MVKQVMLTESREYFQEYCNNTSINGLKYIGGEKRSIIEKVVWLIIFCCAVAVCSYMIYETYKKWENSPVVLRISQNPTNISDIPFPAVTICPQTKAKQSIYNFTKLYIKEKAEINMTDDEKKHYNRLRMICDYMISSEYFANIVRQIVVALFDLITSDFETDELISFLIEAAPSLNETFKTCSWQKSKRDCDALFRPILTEEGICFTFNMLKHNNIYNQEVYNYPEFNEPWEYENITETVLESGVKHGLQIELRAKKTDFDYVCKGAIQGFKVILHEPGDIAMGRTQYIQIPLDQDVTVAIQPNVITTSPSLKKGYSPKKRNCFFNEERRLAFFKNYTQENCKLECLTNRTFNECKCVAFYMPRQSDMKLCGSGKDTLYCILKIENILLISKKSKTDQDKYSCDCLPSCDSIAYNAETSQIQYDWKKITYANNEIEDILLNLTEEEKTNRDNQIEQYHYSQLNIFFKESQFLIMERSELYGVTDFIANCGGIFGLFTGFSILSFIEIVYFLTLRVWINKRLFGKFLIKTPQEEPSQISIQP